MFFITSLWGRETVAGRENDEDVWGTGWGTRRVEKDYDTQWKSKVAGKR